MDRLHRNIIVAALGFILFSSIAGALYAFTVEQETLLLLREQYAAAFTAAAQGEPDRAAELMQSAQEQNFRYVRIIDAHTHYIKLAALLLLLSLLLLRLDWTPGRQGLFAGAMVTGIVLFPTSVYLQTLKPGLLFQGTAAIGALLIILAMVCFVFHVFRQPEQAGE